MKVEVCVTSVEEAIAAQKAGADSVELCTWLACGGVTPTSGLVDAVRTAVGIPVRVLVRPAPGGFVYSPAEVHSLLTDAEIFGGGAIGLVTGALDEEGRAHLELMRSVIGVAPESEITFHRAIDFVPDPDGVVDACLALKIDRILSSGGSTRAVEGAVVLKRLVQRAGDDLVIAAAGGIDAGNVVELVSGTGVGEVHFSAQKPRRIQSSRVELSTLSPGQRFGTEPDAAKIEGVINALVKAGLR